MDGWIDQKAKARFTCDLGVGWLVCGKGERVLAVKDGFDRGLGGRGRASEQWRCLCLCGMEMQWEI
jgi:hypothetical protein